MFKKDTFMMKIVEKHIFHILSIKFIFGWAFFEVQRHSLNTYCLLSFLYILHSFKFSFSQMFKKDTFMMKIVKKNIYFIS